MFASRGWRTGRGWESLCLWQCTARTQVPSQSACGDAAARERGRALSCLPVPGPRAQPVHTWSCGVPRVPHSFSGAWEACSSGKNYIFIASLETTTVLKSIYSKVLFKFPSQTSEFFSASILAFGQLQVLTTLLSQQMRSFNKRIS